MLFREVLDSAITAIRQAAILDPAHEATLLRDVEGRLRLIVGLGAGGAPPFPDTAMQNLESQLRQKLGRWLAAAPAVWRDEGTNKGAAGLALQLARKQREIAPWNREASDPAWFLLERHAAKRTWAGEIAPRPPWPIQAVDARRKPAIVTFFSHKGGVGRTTCLAAVALHLARAGWRVAVVDMDIEAPGIGELFLPATPKAGVLDFLVEMGSDGTTTARDITAFVSESRFVGDGKGIQLVPAGELDDAFVEMLARLDLQDTALDQALALRIRALFEQLQSAFSVDVVLVDARAGMHEVAGLMLSGLTHAAVVVGTSSPQSWAGVRRVARLLSVPHDPNSADPRPLVLVHGMAPSANDPNQAREEGEFATQAYDLLSAEYYPEGQVPQQTDLTSPHAPVVIRWTADLRGGGGSLSDAAIQVLLTQPYRELASRILKQFGRRLEEP